MKHLKIIVLFAAFMLVSCTGSNKFIVTELGYEPEEYVKSIPYNLPKTVFKVSVECEEEVFVPGPYADYALKLLGIENVQKERSLSYKLTGVDVEALLEPDENHFYSINVIEGDFEASQYEWAMKNSLILPSGLVLRDVFGNEQGELREENIFYTDLGMEPNEEKIKQTIYKTILTDTSFVKVPVTTEQIEQKTLSRKAEEAANQIFELRTDRYYMSAGLLSPYPQDFDLETATNNLNFLEQEYLSLFLGKNVSRKFVKEYFVEPKGLEPAEAYIIDSFSTEFGPGAEGEDLTIRFTSGEKAASLRNILPQQPEELSYNKLYYRIPMVADVEVSLVGTVLYKERVSIYQAGAMVNVK